MKIKKNRLMEHVRINEGDEDALPEVDIQNASTGEIADAVQQSAEDNSGGTKSISDGAAAAVASEIKDVAVEVGAGSAVLGKSPSSDEKDVLRTTNAITKTLDHSLKRAMKSKRRGASDNANVLIVGMPGSGKTATIGDWAAANGINLVLIAANDPELETAIYGFTIQDKTSSDKNAVTKAYSDFLDDLDKPNSVLFLDELNRAKPNLRRALMTVVNEHSVRQKGYPNSERHFDNLLFTIVAINPGGLKYDVNADNLSPAELGRFLTEIRFDSNVEATEDYFTKRWDKEISRLDKDSPYYMEDLEEALRDQDFGLFLIKSPKFKYDTEEDLPDAYAEPGNAYHLLSQRKLTDGIVHNYEGDTDEFIDWVRDGSKLLPDTKKMLIEIASSYKKPALADLIKKKQVLSPELAGSLPASDDSAIQAAGAATPAEPEDVEDDDEFFHSAAGGKTVMSPGDVERTIMAAIDSWDD